MGCIFLSEFGMKSYKLALLKYQRVNKEAKAFLNITPNQDTIFSFKVKVKVTMSLTLVSFERKSLVEYACQIWRVYLLRFKSYSEC